MAGSIYSSSGYHSTGVAAYANLGSRAGSDSGRNYHDDGGRGLHGRSSNTSGPNNTNRTDGSRRTNNPYSVSRSRTVTDSKSSALKLTLKTAEGDTVELSVEAQSVHQSSNAFSRDAQGTQLQHTESQGDALQASIKVTGNLNDQELSDIKDLLSSLGSTDAKTSQKTSNSTADAAPRATAQPSTISAYSYSLTRVHEHTESRTVAYA